MDKRSTLVSDLIDVCHRLYARGLVTASDGNISGRLPNGHILATRSGINKGMVTGNDLVEVTIDGLQVGGSGKPSTELGMHRFIYAERPDVMAVVHAHPTYATGFATARIPLDKCLLPEVIVGLGSIPLAGYGTPSTAELAESLSPFVKSNDAILMMNHGAVTCGKTLMEAYFRMEKVEHAAHITFVATMLGGARPLSLEQLEKLRRVSPQSYGKDVPGMAVCEPAPQMREDEEIPDERLREYVEEAIRKMNLR
ncbi:MAG: class II aldolase/adducin family protein [Ignavibacteria bacterium]|nr:class II aldolase/adducin family protein [Ignavibacteria bacterium]